MTRKFFIKNTLLGRNKGRKQGRKFLSQKGGKRDTGSVKVRSQEERLNHFWNMPRSQETRERICLAKRMKYERGVDVESVAGEKMEEDMAQSEETRV